MSNINYHDSLLVAPLRIIALNNCKELGEKVNQLIIERRQKRASAILPLRCRNMTVTIIWFPMTVHDLVPARDVP